MTAFADTTECDPEADDADVQVVQAFVSAYNQRDSQRLSELVPQTDEIWDLGGVPHLGTLVWDDVVAWAEKGWEVDDRLELVGMIRYGPTEGSDVTVLRTNGVLAADGISSLTMLIKVPSHGCVIERLIVAVEPTAPGGCAFYETYVDKLAGSGAGNEVPPNCDL